MRATTLLEQQLHDARIRCCELEHQLMRDERDMRRCDYAFAVVVICNVGIAVCAVLAHFFS